ncbi:hypothetical protein STCU_11897 [Strigomonas culicis]|uniref:Uncharacterized protein n=1 Tax=Strigomonas culicis TaxID=28005 RepID=S9ULS3_9TRYP|nr:hypothetical protein STCU_11897 [Strigomonas culicis]|eukprot:EPY15601.1 hypothetical protein STCU_11897 [Strigomonas culicis]
MALLVQAYAPLPIAAVHNRMLYVFACNRSVCARQPSEGRDPQLREMENTLAEYEEALQKAEIAQREAREVAHKREKELQEVLIRMERMERQREKDKQESERAQQQLVQTSTADAEAAEKRIEEYMTALEHAEAAEQEAAETIRRQTKALQELQFKIEQIEQQREKDKQENERAQQQQQLVQPSAADTGAREKIEEYKTALQRAEAAEAAEKKTAETIRRQAKELQDMCVLVQTMEKQKERDQQRLKRLEELLSQAPAHAPQDALTRGDVTAPVEAPAAQASPDEGGVAEETVKPVTVSRRDSTSPLALMLQHYYEAAARFSARYSCSMYVNSGWAVLLVVAIISLQYKKYQSY